MKLLGWRLERHTVRVGELLLEFERLMKASLCFFLCKIIQTKQREYSKEQVLVVLKLHLFELFISFQLAFSCPRYKDS